MTSPYFRKLPSFEYVSRLPDAKISDYIEVKNIFKRGRIRPDIFENVSFFEKYKIEGNDRPDNVASKVYEDSTLDWIILLSNNIVNIQTEWPLTQASFDTYLREKYGTVDEYISAFKSVTGETINEYSVPRNSDGSLTEEETYYVIYNGIHHYETTEVKNSQGCVIVPAGLQVSSEYSISYYDYFIDSQVDTGNIAIPVTNYEYEEKLENNKRNIYVLKPRYLNIILEDIEGLMTYKEGSSQYVREDLKRADNIRLYQ